MKNIIDTVNDVCMVRQCMLTVAMLWVTIMSALCPGYCLYETLLLRHRHIDVHADINNICEYFFFL